MQPQLRTALRWHPPLMWFAAAMSATAVVSAVGYLVDDRILLGVPIWAKPLKFSLSFAVYAVTLAWLAARLRRPRPRRLARWTGTVIAGAAGLEMAAILLQVVRGRQSHFNQSTPFDSAVFAAMGGFVVVIFLATTAVAVANLVDSPGRDRALTWSVRLGLAISVAGMSVGFLMTRPTPAQSAESPTRGAHAVGVGDGGPGLPLLGWSTTGGDLRVPHFIGLHALQAVPLLVLVLTLLPAGLHFAQRTRVRLVVVGAGAYAGVFVLTLSQALRGQPVADPDLWTVLALTGLVVAVVVGTALVLASNGPEHGRPRRRTALGSPRGLLTLPARR